MGCAQTFPSSILLSSLFDSFLSTLSLRSFLPLFPTTPSLHSFFSPSARLFVPSQLPHDPHTHHRFCAQILTLTRILTHCRTRTHTSQPHTRPSPFPSCVHRTVIHGGRDTTLPLSRNHCCQKNPLRPCRWTERHLLGRHPANLSWDSTCHTWRGYSQAVERLESQQVTATWMPTTDSNEVW